MATTKKALRQLADEVRAELGLSRHDPFDPHIWAQEYGVPFISLNDVPLPAEARRRFIVDAPELWSAALVQNGTGHVVIYNPAHTPARIRSNLAHEVAHFVAEHTISAAWVDQSRCAGTSKEQEGEASELAGALLIPADQALQHAIRGANPDAVAKQYGVSLEMAQWRMRISGGAKIASRSRARKIRAT
ncbi:ImmA/IrrE family metallo-endopeptidase [Rhodococcus qingshengii]|uniref:ImmA/IrrE family metallo-endopeptidase n=1 Tax=Rhodococcus TaxID=1827 RepID=UPI00110E4F86|nr:ImmA/IrrE family metallo-endopeptidase [Rhodococcus sp. KBS0724]TSD39702.1 ImmA/IrrE family metallo-endopeptidase [Rhodococcus sp. KBS0724]